MSLKLIESYKISKYSIEIYENENEHVLILVKHKKNGHYDKIIPFTPIVNERVKIPANIFPKYLVEKFPWIVEQPEVIQ